jgi:hypothetical protein
MERRLELKVRRLIATVGLALPMCVFLAAGGAREARSDGVTSVVLVVPGMNQTELQSVLGPPDYIQVKGLRSAWQYCPRRFFIRFLDRFFRNDDDLFVTVWFNAGRVEHMRAYPGRNMGQCEDFFAAFSWEDAIDDIAPMGVEAGGGYPIK